MRIMPEIPDGYFLLARKIFTSSLWSLSTTDRILAITSIGMANHSPARWATDVGEISISEGQFITSWGHWAAKANLTVGETRGSAKRLQKVSFLNRQMHKKAGRAFMLITIRKYEVYQDHARYSNKVLGKVVNRGRTGDEQGTNNKQIIKEGKNETPGGSPIHTNRHRNDHAKSHPTPGSRLADAYKASNGLDSWGRAEHFLGALATRVPEAYILRVIQSPNGKARTVLDIKAMVDAPPARPRPEEYTPEYLRPFKKE